MLVAPNVAQPPSAPTPAAVAPDRSILRDVLVSVVTAVITALILEKVLRRRR